MQTQTQRGARRHSVNTMLAAASALGAMTAVAPAATFNVGDGDVMGLIAAINAANSNDEANTINLAQDGLYTLTEVVFGSSPTGLPQITSELTINGNGSTVQRSDAKSTPNFRVFNVSATGDVTLNDLTIRWGTGNTGGNIVNAGTFTLNNCTVAENLSPTTGGGILNTGALTLNGCSILNHIASGNGGAGIFSQGANAVLMAENCLFSGNVCQSSAGGAIRNSVSASGTGGIATLTNCVLANNATPGANGWGGAIDNDGTMTIIDTHIHGNSASVRGGAIATTRTLNINGSTIEDNHAVSHGGAIYNSIGFVTVIDSEIKDNSTDADGGGIFHTGTSSANSLLTIQNSVVSGNIAAERGGGIDSNRPIDITDSTISGNHAGSGAGGIDHSINDASLLRTTITENTTNGNGGGFANSSGGTVMLDACTINHNAAIGDGGGIDSLGGNVGTLMATNTTISSNTAGDNGGGINNTRTGADRIQLANATVFANAANSGGGIRNGGSATSVRFGNSIIAGSTTGGDLNGDMVDDGYNIIEDGIGITQPTSAAGDPNLGPLADNGGATQTHALLCGSIAIDAGDCLGGAILEDQRGIARPQGKACDIGAFELVSIPADLNCDGVINVLDLLILLGNWGDCPDAQRCPADLNGDESVDVLDLLLMLSNWG